MKKLLKITVLFAALSLLLVACQPEVEEEPVEEPAAEEEAEEEEAEEASEEEMEEEADEEMDEEMEEEASSDLMSVGAACEESGSLIESITAVDEMTVQVDLCRPDSAFLEKAAFAAFHIQPSEWFEATGGSGDILEQPIGTGPYAVAEWNRGESIIFTRNDDYWGEPAPSETLVFRWNSEGAARLNELRAGTVDGIDNPSPDDFESIREDADLQLIDRPGLNTFYFAMTNTFEPFGDPMVRQAVAMGIDRQRVVDNFYPPGSEVASHFTPCAIVNGCAGEEWYEFDPEAARAMLADAGYPDGFESTIYYRDVFRNYLPEPGLVAVEFQTQLEENLGITTNIEVMESGQFIEESSLGQLDGFYLLGWGADYPHVTNFLDFHFAEANIQFGDPHPEIYEALLAGAAIADTAEAEPFYEEANNAIKELVPMVPIAHGGSGAAYNADVENAIASPLSNEAFAGMTPGDRDTFVWMQNAEPISLYCLDESDGESLRACEQVTEGLYAYEYGGTAPIPALATECVPNDDLTQWVCTLRDGVVFHDGSSLDANDVVMSWAVGLDASNPFHVGNTGVFQYWSYLWGLINEPEAAE